MPVALGNSALSGVNDMKLAKVVKTKISVCRKVISVNEFQLLTLVQWESNVLRS